MKSGKILYLVNVDWFFLSHRLPIALSMIEAGFDVHIASGITNKQKILESYGLTVHPIPIVRGKASLISEVKSFWSVMKILRHLRPDILHLVTIKPVLYGGLASHFCKVKGVVVAISGLGYVFTAEGKFSGLRKKLTVALYFFALKHANLKVIFQNKDDCQILSDAIKLPAKAIVMIPGSGVDLADFSYEEEPSGPTIVVMASRLLKDKGVFEYVKASTELRKHHSNVVFKLVGSLDLDNPASVTQQQLDIWFHGGSVEVLGQHDDMNIVLSSSHIIVLPSYREGFPRVLIEAAACGRAVVTTDVPGCRDAIIPNQTGLLVPARNSQALAGAIDMLLKDDKKRKDMGLAGRRLAEKRYDIEQVVATHLEIYQELMHSK